MITDISAKQLAIYFKKSESWLHAYLQPHRKILDDLATKRSTTDDGKDRKNRCYNSEQLKYIIENIFKGAPLGYEFDGNTLVKKTDYV